MLLFLLKTFHCASADRRTPQETLQRRSNFTILLLLLIPNTTHVTFKTTLNTETSLHSSFLHLRFFLSIRMKSAFGSRALKMTSLLFSQSSASVRGHIGRHMDPAPTSSPLPHLTRPLTPLCRSPVIHTNLLLIQRNLGIIIPLPIT